ncbi:MULTISPECIES: hypothetical protein [Halopenitus]|uniref:Uncharacterized protein n=1 Tax=Halopenitus malekzadehii TaxID=1267564 RepID=A0A1H6IZT1_9EURY|nr:MULTISPECIES: hypothetical protein [Halopenitus]SEH52020.1 hypothetical protein SAMN05192561_10485 [Halopenitus malekzadehii]
MNGHTPTTPAGTSRSRVAEWAALVGEDVPEDRLSEDRIPDDDTDR